MVRLQPPAAAAPARVAAPSPCSALPARPSHQGRALAPGSPGHPSVCHPAQHSAHSHLSGLPSRLRAPLSTPPRSATFPPPAGHPAASAPVLLSIHSPPAPAPPPSPPPAPPPPPFPRHPRFPQPSLPPVRRPTSPSSPASGTDPFLSAPPRARSPSAPSAHPRRRPSVCSAGPAPRRPGLEPGPSLGSVPGGGRAGSSHPFPTRARAPVVSPLASSWGLSRGLVAAQGGRVVCGTRRGRSPIPRGVLLRHTRASATAPTSSAASPLALQQSPALSPGGTS